MNRQSIEETARLWQSEPEKAKRKPKVIARAHVCLCHDADYSDIPELSPPPKPPLHSAPPRPLEGARIMRRREAGRGAAPAGFVATKHSGGIGAPPGTARNPCQELADARRQL